MSSRIRFVGLVCALMTLAIGTEARAQTTYTWNTAGTDWGTAANWTPNTVPNDLVNSIAAFGSRATIANQPVVGTGSYSVRGLTFDSTGVAAWSLGGGTGFLAIGQDGIANAGLTTIEANLLSNTGTINLTGSGTLQFGTANATTNYNIGSQALRSNGVNIASGLTLTTGNVTGVGANADLRVGSLSGSGSIAPGNTNGTNGTINVFALSSATYSGTVTTTSGLVLRGGNGTTQTFSGNATALTGTIGVNSGATLALSGTGDSTSGVLGSLALAPRGGTIALDNTGGNTSAASGRIADAATVAFGGGKLSLLGNSAGTTENVGILTLNSGAATVSVAHNGGAGGTALSFANSGTFTLRTSTSMTVNFEGIGGTLGSSGANPRITFTGTPFTGTGGLFANASGDTTVGFATVNGTEWAGIGANAFLSMSRYKDDLLPYPYYFHFYCAGGVFAVSRAYEHSIFGDPYHEPIRYRWDIVSAGNSCSPFLLSNGTVFFGGDNSSKVTISE